MPIRPLSAPETFETLKNQLFYDCKDVFGMIYTDGVLILKDDKENQYKHLRTVLLRLQENSLYAFLKKF